MILFSSVFHRLIYRQESYVPVPFLGHKLVAGGAKAAIKLVKDAMQIALFELSNVYRCHYTK